MQKETENKNTNFRRTRVEAVKIHWILYSRIAQRLPAISGINPGSTLSAECDLSEFLSLSVSHLPHQ